ncbi:MAG: hypothetical protein JW779_00880 [Candidatus Thorarchaeota archaeon]|nr:hypothetical protein [Candidatus Thorarchaeota archaeon]
MARLNVHMRKEWLIVLALILLIFSFFTWFNWGFHGDVIHRPPSNTIVWETSYDPESMDPAVDNTGVGDWILSNIYETLYTYPFNSSDTTSLIPLLALGEPIISPDGRNYTIALRQNITFQDGTPFNASCVKWNIERAMKIFSDSQAIWTFAETLKGGNEVKQVAVLNGTSSSVFQSEFDSWIVNSSAIMILDTYTVRFVLEEAFSPFVTILASKSARFMSPTYAISHASDLDLMTWEAYGVDYGQSENYMHTHTCGTGPYTIVDWVEDQYIELESYEKYWRETTSILEVLPPSNAGSIEKIYIRMNYDALGRELNLRNGVVDGVEWPLTEAHLVWDPVNEITRYLNINVSTGGYKFETLFLGFNMGNLTVTVNGTTVITECPFNNRNFRRAASFAFDYQNFIDSAVNGYGIQGKGPIPAGMVGHNDSGIGFNYNLTAAVAEWNLAMQDPVFVNSLNTINNSIIFYHLAGSSLRDEASSLLQIGLEDVYWIPESNHTGLNNNMTFLVESLTYSEYLEYLEERRLPMLPFGWVPDYSDPISYLQPICHSEGALARQIGYNNTDVDMWCDLAISENNPTLRQIYFNNIQNAVADEAPYIWGYQKIEFQTWRDWLRGDGLVFNPMRDVYFYHISKDYSGTVVTNQIPWPSFIELASISWVTYILADYFKFQWIRRKQLKFALFIICTSITLFVTAWNVLFPSMWPQPGFLTSELLFIIYPGLLWVPWYLMYRDTKRAYRRIEQNHKTMDIQ